MSSTQPPPGVTTPGTDQPWWRRPAAIIGLVVILVIVAIGIAVVNLHGSDAEPTANASQTAKPSNSPAPTATASASPSASATEESNDSSATATADADEQPVDPAPYPYSALLSENGYKTEVVNGQEIPVFTSSRLEGSINYTDALAAPIRDANSDGLDKDDALRTILTDPYVAEAWGTALYEQLPQLREANPWLSEFADASTVNDRAEEALASEGDERVAVAVRYANVAALVGQLDATVIEATTTWNYHAAVSSDGAGLVAENGADVLPEVRENPSQYVGEFLAFGVTLKGQEPGCPIIAMNTGDARPAGTLCEEEPEPAGPTPRPKSTPSPTPTPEPSPTPTPTPEPTPTPTPEPSPTPTPTPEPTPTCPEGTTPNPENPEECLDQKDRDDDRLNDLDDPINPADPPAGSLDDVATPTVPLDPTEEAHSNVDLGDTDDTTVIGSDGGDNPANPPMREENGNVDSDRGQVDRETQNEDPGTTTTDDVVDNSTGEVILEHGDSVAPTEDEPATEEVVDPDS